MIDRDDDEARPAGRSEARRLVGALVIVAATAQSLGLTLRMPSHLEVNDISRWCTVWSLLERGTYEIDECPWQGKTNDKVYKPRPSEKGDPKAPRHFYSSKPPLLPTLIAGALYPFRHGIGVKLDREVPQDRVERTTRKYDPDDPTKYEDVTETPKPIKWPVYVFYFKPVVVALNVVPYLFFLIAFARMLDGLVRNDWAWFAGLVSAAWATPLTTFDTTLNNHTVGAYSAFFAALALMRIWATPRVDDEGDRPRPPYLAYASAGFFGAFAACNELPAAAFGVLLFLIALSRSPRATLLAFAPAAAIPCAAFLITLYRATGGFTPFYAEFGTASYTGYEWSYWNSPLEFDWFDKHPEPKGLYLFHLTIGHHGMFSLTPIFLLAIPAMLRGIVGVDRRASGIARLTALLTAGLVAFYVYKTNNYGGSTQGPRWLFWIYPLWLILVPIGFESGQTHRGARWFGLLCLGLSAMSVGYGFRTPWSHPWVLDMIEHLNWYTLVR